MCVYMHVTVGSEKSHEFGKKQGSIYGSIWKEEKEGTNDGIML